MAVRRGMDLERLGHVLRARRMDLSKTLAEVGNHAKCTRQNVYKVEKALSNPTVNTLNKIADGLDMDLHLVVLPRDEQGDGDRLVADLLHRLAQGDRAVLDGLAALLGQDAGPAVANGG